MRCRNLDIVALLIAATTFGIGQERGPGGPSPEGEHPAAPLTSAPAPPRAESTAVRAGPDAPVSQADPELDELRRHVAAATADADYIDALKTLLFTLERRGLGMGTEAEWCLERLRSKAPNAPEWLWRRAQNLRHKGENAAALEAYRELIKIAPNDSLAVRAKRALPALYSRLEDPRSAASAYEQLLDEKLAAPTAVLGPLLKLYQSLGMQEQASRTLSRLREAGGDEVMSSPDLQWLAADASDRAGEKSESAAMLTDFAKQHPDDERAPEALLRAAQNMRELGNDAQAIELATQAIDKGQFDFALAARGHLERADLYAQQNRIEEAEAEYRSILGHSPDLMQVAVALHGLVKLSLEHRGMASTLFELAAVAQGADRFAAPLARRHIETLLKKEATAIAARPIDAAAIAELGTRLGIVPQLPLEIRLAAAQLHEETGNCARALDLYRSFQGEPGAAGDEARHGIARCEPTNLPDGIEPDDADRLEALGAAQRWDQIEEALVGRLDGHGGETKRTLAARAAYARKDLPRASELLEPLSNAGGGAALLRADARAMAGRWTEACADYRAAAPTFQTGPEHAWIELRLAACEEREGNPAAARDRLETLIESKPLDPVLNAARRLLHSIPEDDGEDSGRPVPKNSAVEEGPGA